MNNLFRPTLNALKTWPDTAQWRDALRVGIPSLLIVAFIGFLGGWLQWNPMADWQAALMAAGLLFFLPALAEETVFRGLLLSLCNKWSPRWGAWISTLLFVAWHPVQALTIGPPWANIFLSPSFLFATLILGIILSHIRIKSQSLWPVIFIHWIAVVIWKTLLGGPFY